MVCSVIGYIVYGEESMVSRF